MAQAGPKLTVCPGSLSVVFAFIKPEIHCKPQQTTLDKCAILIDITWPTPYYSDLCETISTGLIVLRLIRPGRRRRGLGSKGKCELSRAGKRGDCA